MDREKAIKAVADFLTAVGEDVTREGLKDTPARVADMYAELLAGNGDDAAKHLSKTFAVQSGNIVIEKDITFSSMCEHHLMPFFGKMAIAYIPQGKVAGLSKLARTVEVYARRLQLQEQLTSQVAQAVYKNLSARGVLVICEAEHTCMTCRGVKKFGSKTVTYSIAGDFPPEKIAEVAALIK
ncbi:MAG TPA: GTP cyclohydrolase I FolE [Candidatus Coproplasma stercorigallinarum]|nr:GTP cyclohydrolase I FolE [Candidatus Coproplasma stercorigallinarum]